jgi:predicted polyphosphate/ATP-dependent NAD kinase
VLVGLVINPIAGMGGRVGLKGTDGQEVLLESLKRGAEPMASMRAQEALRAAAPLDQYDFITASGSMGEDLLREMGARFRVTYVPSTPSSRRDTQEVCRRIAEQNANVLIFAGGDGTARDVTDAIDLKMPVIAIPSGVKMHSGVFSTTPKAAGRILRMFASGSLPLRKAEVMDIDEDAFRKGRLSASLYGHLTVPYERSLIQSSKSETVGGLVEEEKEEIGQYIAENLEEDVIYVLGPGTTVEAVAKQIGAEKTILGVDVVMNGKVTIKDASENDLIAVLDGNPPARIVVTPIGAQGFIFGRGNQQISPRIIRSVGLKNIIVIASHSKLREIERLKVDTGDSNLDAMFKGHLKVVVGYARRSVVKVE